MKVHRIRDWKDHFEKADMRKSTRFHWVAMPTRHDGKGFKRISRMADAFVVFGAWNLIVQIAAKMPDPGTLLDDDGPVGPDEMELITGFPAEGFARALAVVTDPKIGWMEAVEESELTPPSGDRPDGTRKPSGNRPATYTHTSHNKHNSGARETVKSGARAESTPQPPEGDAAVVEALRTTGFGEEDVGDLSAHPRATLERIDLANANYDALEKQGRTKGSRTGYVLWAIRDCETLSPQAGVKSANGRKVAGQQIQQRQVEERQSEEDQRRQFELAAKVVSELPAPELNRYVAAAMQDWPEKTREFMRQRDPRKFQTWVGEIYRRVVEERGEQGESPPRPAMRLAQ